MDLRPTGAASDRAQASATRIERVVWTVAGLVAWSVLWISSRLVPDARGFGTHEQLGMAPCTFTARTGIPCPGCGLTTSFALLAHGHVLRALETHAMGPPLFALTVALALYAPFAVARRRPIRIVVATRWPTVALVVTACAGVATFAIRIAHVTAMR